MKTRFWVILFAAVIAVCAALSVFFFMDTSPAEAVQIRSDGVLLYTLPLSIDREVVIESSYGTNTVTVKNGKVAVTAADCPDHYCMHRGYCDSGAQIVCLPNRLVLTFTGASEIDGVAG